MRVWYHPLINDTIVTMNPRYNILLNEVVWEMLPLGSISQSAYAERTLGIQMFGMLCWRRVHPLSAEPFQNILVPSGKFIGRTFAFKKVFGVSKEG